MGSGNRNWYGTTQACLVCGTVFTRVGPNHKYCAKKCREIAAKTEEQRMSPTSVKRCKRGTSIRRADEFGACAFFHEMIDKAMQRYKTFRALSEACGIKQSTLAQWANREVLPMPGSRIKFEIWAEETL